MGQNISLLQSTSRVEAPIIKVQIGNYSFGVHQRTTARQRDEKGFYTSVSEVYPNYVQSLEINKINGQVNIYTLTFKYAITATDDPNFFEKVFSSVSKTRKIVFSYGDASLPEFIYKEEEGIITDVQSRFDIKSSTIDYIVSAQSTASLSVSGTYTFINNKPKKPSDEIKRILYDPTYGLQQIFYGMNNKGLVLQEQLIASDDKIVQLETKTNISVLDYLKYLVTCMVPSGANTEVKKQDIYVLNFIDDITGKFSGPYFKISRCSTGVNDDGAYEIDVGFHTHNVVTDFSVDNNQNYSILYDWQESLNDNQYVRRIDNDGRWVDIYAPNISSRNNSYSTRISDSTYWTRLTEFPITASITLKGLLRPALLMTHVRLNVYFYGNKHITSGLYIVTKQVDRVDASGYRTTLNLMRIKGDEIN